MASHGPPFEILSVVVIMADVNVVEDYEMYLIENQHKHRKRFERFNACRTMPEAQIKKAFRFSSENIDRLIELLR